MDGAQRRAEALAGLDLFARCEPDDLLALTQVLGELRGEPGDVLLREGERGSWFAIVVEGEARISCAHQPDLGTAGPGSVLGELALLREAPRTATVTAVTPITAYVGGPEAFDLLLGITGARERMGRAAAQRLAAHARAVPVTVAGGTELSIRPGLPTDRERLEAGLARLSAESRRRRFFTGGPVPKRVIDYLVDVDYVDHFVFVVTERDGQRGVASGRYVRLHDDPSAAEIALGVVDDHQGKGIGKLLLGALGAAASAGDVARFKANVLADNRPMRRLLDQAAATWRLDEPGVMEAVVPVAAVRDLIDPALANELADVAAQVIEAAHLALA